MFSGFFFFSWQGFQLDISSFVSEYEKSIKRSPNELEICYCIELGLLRCLVWLRFVKPFLWRALCLVLCSAQLSLPAAALLLQQEKKPFAHICLSAISSFGGESQAGKELKSST